MQANRGKAKGTGKSVRGFAVFRPRTKTGDALTASSRFRTASAPAPQHLRAKPRRTGSNPEKSAEFGRNAGYARRLAEIPGCRLLSYAECKRQRPRNARHHAEMQDPAPLYKPERRFFLEKGNSSSPPIHVPPRLPSEIPPPSKPVFNHNIFHIAPAKDHRSLRPALFLCARWEGAYFSNPR